MMMKSIRLDFPAEATNGVSDAQLLLALESAASRACAYWAQVGDRGIESSVRAIAQAAREAQVEVYDDLREKNDGRPMVGPVFYIP